MKVFYFIALGAFCAALNGVGARAETIEAALAKENMHGLIVASYAQCPEGRHYSKYLDNIYGGTRCYQCLNGTAWKQTIQKCS
jgi:hypothetical protein